MLMISSPLSFSLSPLEGHLLTTQSLKRTKLKMKRGGEKHTSVCLHVKTTWLSRDFNQCQSFQCDICKNVSHIFVKLSILKQMAEEKYHIEMGGFTQTVFDVLALN